MRRGWLAGVVIISVGCQAPAPPPASPAPVVRAGLCEAHGVEQALCTRCNPALAPIFKARGDWCEEHDFPESICPVCAPGASTQVLKEQAGAPASGAAQGAAAFEGRVVRFTDAATEQRAGIEVRLARLVDERGSLRCAGHVRFDQEQVAEVRALVPGVVRRVLVKVGERVEAGAPLFELESREVSLLQAQLRASQQRVKSAQAVLERQRAASAEGVISRRELEQTMLELGTAQAEAQGAATTLRLSGAGGQGAGRYTLHAPLAGVLITREATLGTLASEGVALATIAEPRRLWVECDIAARDAGRVRAGQRLWGAAQDDAGASFQGQIMWISPSMEPTTRTVAVRAAVLNEEERLREGQFVQAQIELAAPAGGAVAVPADALQRVGELEVIFVRQERGVYEARVVTRVGESGEEVWVKGRVGAGDAVVVEGAFLLRTEVVPGSIGAGCCEPAPGGK